MTSISHKWLNNDERLWECKKRHVCEKDYIWNPATCSCQNGIYLASIIDDSAITCDEIIDAEVKSNDEETKTCLTSFKEKNVTCKCRISIFYLHFY